MQEARHAEEAWVQGAGCRVQARHAEEEWPTEQGVVPHPRTVARFEATFDCTREDAERALRAAAKINADAETAAALLFEPEEVERILMTSAFNLEHGPLYRCTHCQRGFHSRAGLQRHSSNWLAYGRCNVQVPRHQPLSPTSPRGAAWWSKA